LNPKSAKLFRKISLSGGIFDNFYLSGEIIAVTALDGEVDMVTPYWINNGKKNGVGIVNNIIYTS